MPGDGEDPTETHPPSSSLSTTRQSATSLSASRRLEAIASNITPQSTMSSDDKFEDIPRIKTVAPDSLEPRCSGKVAIVTGANSPLGIGRAAAHLYAKHGAKAVYICDASDNFLATHKREIESLYPSCEVHTVQLDVGDEDAVKAVCQDALTRYQRLDIMFANAGVTSISHFEDLDAESFMAVMKVNALGVFLCFKHAAIAMKQTSPVKPKSSGALVGTASVAGLRSNAGPTEYSASKAAVVSMVQTFAYQLTGTNIRANAICPGLTETGMTAPVFEHARARGTMSKVGQLNPLRRAGIADEIARVALFLSSDESSYVNGQALAVCGGLSAGHPFVPGKLA